MRKSNYSYTVVADKQDALRFKLAFSGSITFEPIYLGGSNYLSQHLGSAQHASWCQMDRENITMCACMCALNNIYICMYIILEPTFEAHECRYCAKGCARVQARTSTCTESGLRACPCVLVLMSKCYMCIELNFCLTIRNFLDAGVAEDTESRLLAHICEPIVRAASEFSRAHNRFCLSFIFGSHRTGAVQHKLVAKVYCIEPACVATKSRFLLAASTSAATAAAAAAARPPKSQSPQSS